MNIKTKNLLKNIGLWFLQILFALVFVMAGFPKLTGGAGWVSRFENWGYPDHFVLVIGAAEVVFALALLVPRLAGYGAAGLAVVMLGAFATHVIHSETTQVPFTGGFFLVTCLLAYARLPRPLPFGKQSAPIEESPR